jgi:hypothetical protein
MSESWSYGWAFFKSGRTGRPPADIDAVELTDWLKGFCAAMADYDLNGEHPSIRRRYSIMASMGIYSKHA